MKINPVKLDFIYFKSKLRDWIFTIELATRLIFSAMSGLPKSSVAIKWRLKPGEGYFPLGGIFCAERHFRFKGYFSLNDF